MGVDGQQLEFDEAGLARLASLQPVFTVDTRQPFGRLSLSLGLLVRSADGEAGFDSPSAALLGLLGCATIGTQYRSDADVDAGRAIARVAQEVWGPEWVDRLQDATFQVGQLRPAPLTRFTASLTYLDTNRFLRNAQSSGLSVAYARAPGVLVPQCHYGTSILSDILSGRRRDRSATWTFSAAAADAGRPESLPSEESPFRIFLHDSGQLDPQLHGIRYCFSADDARRAYTAFSARLDRDERVLYAEIAVSTVARALRLPQLELVSIDDAASFDWWKDHISRASAGEILIGLRDKQARRTAHGLLVQTSILPEVVDAADSDGSLRERLRIYVKNLEFDVIDARYRDDLRRGGARMLKQGGTAPSKAEAVDMAKAILEATMDG